MKCAFELQLIAEVKAAEIAKRIAKEKAEKEERERLAREKRTLQFCEQLGERLENIAKNGHFPETDFLAMTSGFLLSKAHSNPVMYSYNPYEAQLDFKVLENWFAPYCFKVSYKYEKAITYPENYVHARLERQIFRVTITPEPKC